MRFLITIPSLRLIVFGIVTLFAAALSWRLLEQPINRLRGEKTRKTLDPIPHGSWEMGVGSLKMGARSVELGAAS
jgi:peptidoglycan/LPS O-acetylase OafA/YrhL